MGTYTNIEDYDLPLKKPLTQEELDRELTAYYDDQEKENPHLKRYDKWFLRVARSDETPHIILNNSDDPIKFYDYETLCSWIAQKVDEGHFLLETEGDRWKIMFDGEGHYKELSGVTYYGEAYDHFLTTYPELPKEIKTVLQAWWTARRL